MTTAVSEPRYTPLETVEPADCVQQPTAYDTRLCPTSDHTIHVAAIVSDYVGLHPQLERFYCRRRLYCSFCEHVVSWNEILRPRSRDDVEIALSRGRTTLDLKLFDHTRQMIGKPHINNDPDYVAGFLAAYPHAAGVSQC